MLVQRDQPAIERSHIDLVAIERHAAVHHIAANEIGTLAPDLGIIAPQGFAGLGVHRIDHAPGAGGVNHAVLHQRRGFQSPRRSHFAAPGQPELGHRLLIDLVQGAEAVIVIGPAVHQPVARVLVAATQFGVAYRRCARAGPDEKEKGKDCRGEKAVPGHGDHSDIWMHKHTLCNRRGWRFPARSQFPVDVR